MALPATDAFTGTDGTQLTTYSANWTLQLGDFDIQSNALAPDSLANSDSLACWTADTFNADQYSQIKIVAVSTAPASIGPAVRVASGATTAYLLFHSSAAWELWKVVAGTWTKINNGASRTLQVNDVLRLEISGTTLTVKINGVAQGSPTTDSDIASGYAGLHANKDDANHRGDDWEGGNLAAGGLSIPVAMHHRRMQEMS